MKLSEKIHQINRISNITAIRGSCSRVSVPEKGTRIIMGLIPSAERYIPCAVKLAKKGAIIHYHGIGSEDPDVAAEELREHFSCRRTLGNA